MKRLLLLAVFLLPMLVLAASAVSIIYQQSSGIPLTANAPGSRAGHPLSAALAIDAGLDLASSYRPTSVWCEVESNGIITGGKLRWWRRSNQTDGGWGQAPGFDETIGPINASRFVSMALELAGYEGGIYCQPTGITETGGDGGLTVVYGFRMERETP